MTVVLLMVCECEHLFPGTDCIAASTYALCAPIVWACCTLPCAGSQEHGDWAVDIITAARALCPVSCLRLPQGKTKVDQLAAPSLTLGFLRRSLRVSTVSISVALVPDRQYVFTTARNVRVSPFPCVLK